MGEGYMLLNEMFFNIVKKQIYETLKKAFIECPYYAKNYQITLPVFDEFTYEYFSSIPLLEKKTVLKYPEEFLNDYSDRNTIVTETTSGSEGIPLLCYKSKNEKLLYSIDLWKMRKKIISDLNPKDRFVHFYVLRRRNDEKLTDAVIYENNILHLPLFDLSPEKLIIYWNEILKFQPRWMHGIPSTIYNLAVVVREYKLPRYLFDFIELTGEYLDQQKVNVIKEVFKCKIANQYGAREFWLLAYGCNNNILHINDKNVFIEEVFNSEFGHSELVVTSLQNQTWPLIRYRLGDIGEIGLNNCSCSINSQFILNLNWGRESEYCTFGKFRFSKVFFSYIIRKLNDNNAGIIQYQIIKQDEDKIQINIVGDKKSEKKVFQTFRDEFSQRQIFIDIDICYSSYIEPNNQTGKTKEFIDLTKSQQRYLYEVGGD